MLTRFNTTATLTEFPEDEDTNHNINNQNINCWSPDTPSEDFECYNSEEDDCYSSDSNNKFTTFGETINSSTTSVCNLPSVNPIMMMDTAVMYDTVDQVKKLSGSGSVGGVSGVLVNGGSALKLAALKQHQQQQLLHQTYQQPQQQVQQHCGGGAGGGDLTEIGAQEISLELQNLIDDSQFSEGLFSEILSGHTKLPGLLSKVTSVADYQQHQHLRNNNNNNTTNLNNNHHQQQHQQHQHVVPAHSPPSSTNSACSSPASPPPNSNPGLSSYNPRTALAYMPQPVHSGVAYNNNATENSSGGPAIKEEPVDPQEFRPCPGGGGIPYASPPIGGGYSPNGLPSYHGDGGGGSSCSNSSMSSNSNGPIFTTLTPSTLPGGGDPHLHLHQSTSPGLNLKALSHKSMRKHSGGSSISGSINGSNKHVDKSSDEYRRRRERNNIAVRKSREKAKLRSRETEEKVKLLVRENERLQKRIELLSEELNVLRSLFSNVGVLPEQLHREIDKHLQSIQQQHQSLGGGLG